MSVSGELISERAALFVRPLAQGAQANFRVHRALHQSGHRAKDRRVKLLDEFATNIALPLGQTNVR